MIEFWTKKILKKFLKNGRTGVAERIVKNILSSIKTEYSLLPAELLVDIIFKTSIQFIIPPRRKGKRIHQIPTPINFFKSLECASARLATYIYKLSVAEQQETIVSDIRNLYRGGLSKALQPTTKMFDTIMENKTHTSLRWK